HVPRLALAADPDGEGDRRVVVAAGDVAAGVDHDHEDRADRHGREAPRAGGYHRAAHGEHEEEGADELDEVFFHGSVLSWPGRGSASAAAAPRTGSGGPRGAVTPAPCAPPAGPRRRPPGAGTSERHMRRTARARPAAALGASEGASA